MSRTIGVPPTCPASVSGIDPAGDDTSIVFTVTPAGGEVAGQRSCSGLERTTWSCGEEIRLLREDNRNLREEFKAMRTEFQAELRALRADLAATQRQQARIVVALATGLLGVLGAALIASVL